MHRIHTLKHENVTDNSGIGRFFMRLPLQARRQKNIYSPYNDSFGHKNHYETKEVNRIAQSSFDAKNTSFLSEEIIIIIINSPVINS